VWLGLLVRDLPGVKRKVISIVMSFLAHQPGELNSRSICFLLLHCGAFLLVISGSRSLARTPEVYVYVWEVF